MVKNFSLINSNSFAVLAMSLNMNFTMSMEKSNNMRRLAGIVLFVVVCGFIGTMTASAAELVDRIVAVVNDDIIVLSELNETFAPVAEKIRSEKYPPEKEAEVLADARMRVLDEMINETLADQEIAQSGIQVDPEEVEATIERVKAMNFYTEEELNQALQMRGLSLEGYRQEIRKQILRSKLVNKKVKSNIVITDADIRGYYEAHPEAYGGKMEYELRNIFMPYPQYGDAADREQVRARMENVLARLQSGEAFSELARTQSQAPNAEDGGELGRFAIDDLSEQLRPVIKSLQAGEFSDVLETDRGFQIFYVETLVKTQPRPLENVSDEIETKLYEQAVNEKFNAWIESLRENSHIKIME